MLQSGKRTFMAAFFVAFLLLTAGCSAEPGNPAEDANVLTIASPTEPATILPTLTDGVWEGLFTNQIFAPLTEVDEAFQVIPGIAYDWEWDAENLTYTFHLREDVFFHDGQQLTAEDVLWTYRYAMHPEYEGTYFPFLQNIAGAAEYRQGETDEVAGLAAPDPFTVTLTFTEPDATALLYVAGSIGIMPRHHYEPFVEQHGVKALKGSERRLPPVGAGPFRWQEWRPGQWIILQRYDDFYRAEPEVPGQMGRARLDEVRVRFLADTDAMFQALQAGDIDLMDGLTAAQFDAAQEQDTLQTVQYPYLFYDQLMFNLQQPKFQDLRVRQAIGHALDRERMAQVVLQGYGSAAAGGHTHPIRWDYSSDLAQLHPEYDPDQTVALMEAAGWTIEKDGQGQIAPGAVWTKDGEQFSFVLAANQPDKIRADFQQLIQADLAAAGFHTELLTMEMNTYLSEYLSGSDWDAALSGWRLGADPGGGFELIFGCMRTPAQGGYNWTRYCSEGGVLGQHPGRLTELDLAGRQEMDLAARREIYREAHEMLVKDLPYVWLAYRDGLLAAKFGLQGLEPVHPQAWYNSLWRLEW